MQSTKIKMANMSQADTMIKKRKVQIPQFLWSVLTLIGLGLLWQVLTVLMDIPSYILPSPLEIISKFISDFSLIFSHSLTTLSEVLLGFGLSLLVGVPLAISIVYSRYLASSFYPIIIAIQCIPMVSVAPILVIWFGYGLATKVLLASLISFFPIVINSVVGFRSLDSDMHDLGRSIGISEWKIFYYLRLPNALPHLFGGFKVGITLAVVGAIVGEFVASERGLGYLQLTANNRLDTVMVFATLFALALLGMMLFFAVHLVERFVMPWYNATKAEGSK
ncbi:ABC transporter permease [Alkalihalobacillus alcalophilus ATCC 27647 = CGMCC 1.3604]|uniref:ABC transporter permease n=2 Tax=Alkalihalobacillus alcalophilus ATCC 27647 = CGMCC 1.3604 TaxID=1218173 RepID=J8Q770_ALKAL|nr:ABC transporter permease [Alkalihalobacillus alcalophilus]AFV25862.1 nitrate/sulfonate/taurine transporter [Alkalihalobacillus alcalophilus ATCC 27647 = CGMCC 1.3604]MED1562073.1 ABC transporter permease [Alkalihalobacillus alcalophilus]THG88284.1 ABC transporter permease [Alkalihalobacillus alcalophilus ATCC 27647 = CGMCC 1.3604]